MTKCNALMPTIFLTLFGSSYLFANSIERPAGSIKQEGRTMLNIPRTESLKSKLVPLHRKINIAEADSSVLKRKETGKKPSSQSSAVIAKSVVSQENSEVDGWDSAARRFDQHDPANTVTKGVRVEDIIEPTSDYRYVAARRKNPFVPDLVLGRAIKQKELNPNDVEIPIINPLQSFSANQLAVIGVWEGSDGVWKALIQTPANQGIETKLGDPAGNSGGRIMSITPDAVVVREFSVRADGTREYRDIPLYMGSDKPVSGEGNIGGRVILRPGSSTPEIESPDKSQNLIQKSPASVPSGIPGTWSSLVPIDPAAHAASGELTGGLQSGSQGTEIPGVGIRTPSFDMPMPAANPGFQGGVP